MVRQAHHERNQQLTVHPELVEGFNQRFPKGLKPEDRAVPSSILIFLIAGGGLPRIGAIRYNPCLRPIGGEVIID
jgi:hypothetical protein